MTRCGLYVLAVHHGGAIAAYYREFDLEPGDMFLVTQCRTTAVARESSIDVLGPRGVATKLLVWDRDVYEVEL